jgi:ribosomal protein S18 acetylase RimI-like enzyme
MEFCIIKIGCYNIPSRDVFILIYYCKAKGIYIMEIRFEKAELTDVEELINIRNSCFYEDYIRYGECPGYNLSKEKMTEIILTRKLYNVICDNKIVGSISVKDIKEEAYYIGCLCVIPEYENKGIGQATLKFIESEFPSVKVWTLETPADKLRNHYFYKKAGFKIVRQFMEGTVRLVEFEKKMK